MSLISLGDGSTLSLDFTTGVLDPRLSFTRSSTGTFINASGNVATASNNVARFDHDPTTLAPRGLLIEASASNLALYSQSFTGGIGWFFTGTGTKSTTNNYATAPDGTTTAARLQLGQNCALKQNAGATGVNHTVSIWVKSNTGSNQTIAFWTGTAAANRTATTSWTRIEAVVNNASAALFDLYNPNATDCDILIWGAQLETGGASSYIPTGASQGSRAADNCVMTGTNFSSWYNQGEGTFLLHCQLNRLGAQHLLNVNVNNVAPRLMITEVSNNLNAASENPSGTNFNFSLGSSSTNATKVIAAFKSLDNAGTRNGATVQTNATLTVPTTVNLMRIGSAEGGYQYMTGTISLLKYWPTRLPNAQLQSLTT